MCLNTRLCGRYFSGHVTVTKHLRVVHSLMIGSKQKLRGRLCVTKQGGDNELN